jgi:predicted metal-dependent hydrolase
MAVGSPDPSTMGGMGFETDEIRELHSTLRAIGHYPQLLRSIIELRDEAASKGDPNMAALWNWLARQVVEVRDGRERHVAARDFSAPAMGEN